jgi:hypothetical protein
VDGVMHYRVIERDDPQVKEFTAELIEKERIFWNEIVIPRDEEKLQEWI